MLLTRAVLIASLWRVRGEAACSRLPVPAEHVLQESSADGVCSQGVPCVALTQLWLHSSRSFSADLQVPVTPQ